MVIRRHLRDDIPEVTAVFLGCHRLLVLYLNARNALLIQQGTYHFFRFFCCMDGVFCPLHTSSPLALAYAVSVFFCSLVSFVGTWTTIVT